MGVVESILPRSGRLEAQGPLPRNRRDGRYIRIMELLERQATITEILGEMNPENLKRFDIEIYISRKCSYWWKTVPQQEEGQA
jgi:hypothetical protein